MLIFNVFLSLMKCCNCSQMHGCIHGTAGVVTAIAGDDYDEVELYTASIMA